MKWPANGRYEEKVYEAKKEKNAYHRRTQVNLAFPFKSRRVCAASISIRGGSKKLPFLYFSLNISATRTRRKTKLCTHLPEYYDEVV